MVDADWFVGGVAIAGGLICLMAALFNQDWFYHFWVARLIESRQGRNAARLFFLVLGLLLGVLGILIVSGWRLRLFE